MSNWLRSRLLGSRRHSPCSTRWQDRRWHDPHHGCVCRPKCFLIYEGLNASSNVYLSKVYFCKKYPTYVSSKLCEFFSSNFVFKLKKTKISNKWTSFLWNPWIPLNYLNLKSLFQVKLLDPRRLNWNPVRQSGLLGSLSLSFLAGPARSSSNPEWQHMHKTHPISLFNGRDCEV